MTTEQIEETIYDTFAEATAARNSIGTAETHAIVMRYDGYRIREREKLEKIADNKSSEES